LFYKQITEKELVMKRCFIYARVSTSEQNKGEFTSIENQEKSCLHFIGIREQEDWKHVRTISDPGYSGKDLDRPGIMELMSEIEAGNVDVIVTYKVDRVSRSLVKFYDFYKLLQQHNVEFVSATQSFDTSASSGRLMLNILLSFAEYEREIISERTKDKLFSNFERGEWQGGWVPFGLEYSKEKKLLYRHPKESKAIEIIFNMLSKDKSPSQIANYLNTAGYKTKTRNIIAKNGKKKVVGGKRIRDDFILKIARNPIYCGCVQFNGTFKKGKHEGIVARALFDKVNKRLGKEKKNGLYNTDEHIHLLKGLIKCKDCGSTMTPFPSGKKNADGTPYLYYACTDVIHNKSESRCRVRSFSARIFENTIKKFLGNLGGNKTLLTGCTNNANKESKKSLKPLMAKQGDLHNRKKKLTTKIKRIIEIMKNEDFLSSDLKEEYKILVKEKESIENELERVNIEIDFKKRDVLSLDVIQKSLQTFSKVVDKLSLADQKELMHLLIKEIRVSPFDPEKEKPPKEKGAFSLKIRNKWLKVEIALYEMPIPSTTYNPSTQKFVFSSNWLPG